MSVEQANARVTVAEDRSCAELVVEPGCPPALLTRDYLKLLLNEQNVEFNAQSATALDQWLATATPSQMPQRIVINRATPPIAGADGALEWLVENAGAAPAPVPSDEQGATDATRDYYSSSAYVMVETGQVIGRITEPTPGEDGRDVLGRTLAARSGKPVQLKCDESIMRDSRGQLISQMRGVLIRRQGAARISQVLEIPEYVDFSTGNIDFDGSVFVRQGVRDLFVLKAGGNVEVQGLIESASIESGGDLKASGGMAGRERGSVKVGGRLSAKYLDNVHGEVKGDLCVEREIINCELVVHGKIDSVNGTIVGGRVQATGAVAIGTLGSAAAVPTRLLLGSVPQLEPIAAQFETIVAKLQAHREAIAGEQDRLTRLVTRPTPRDKERQTELFFESQQIDRSIARANDGLGGVLDEISRRRTVQVNVARKLFRGVIVDVRGQRWRIDDDLRGPVEIRLGAGGTVIWSREGAPPQPISAIAKLEGLNPES